MSDVSSNQAGADLPQRSLLDDHLMALPDGLAMTIFQELTCYEHALRPGGDVDRHRQQLEWGRNIQQERWESWLKRKVAAVDEILTCLSEGKSYVLYLRNTHQHAFKPEGWGGTNVLTQEGDAKMLEDLTERLPDVPVFSIGDRLDLPMELVHPWELGHHRAKKVQMLWPTLRLWREVATILIEHAGCIVFHSDEITEGVAFELQMVASLSRIDSTFIVLPKPDATSILWSSGTGVSIATFAEKFGFSCREALPSQAELVELLRKPTRKFEGVAGELFSMLKVPMGDQRVFKRASDLFVQAALIWAGYERAELAKDAEILARVCSHAVDMTVTPRPKTATIKLNSSRAPDKEEFRKIQHYLVWSIIKGNWFVEAPPPNSTWNGPKDVLNRIHGLRMVGVVDAQTRSTREEIVSRSQRWATEVKAVFDCYEMARNNGSWPSTLPNGDEQQVAEVKAMWNKKMEGALRCHYLARDPDQAEFSFHDCVADGFICSDEDMILSALMYLGLLQLDLHSYSAADSNLELARTLAERMNRPGQLAIITWTQVVVLLEGDQDSAVARASLLIDRAFSEEGIAGIPWRQSMIQHAASRIAHKRGDVQEAQTLLTEAKNSYLEHRSSGRAPTGMRAQQVSELTNILHQHGIEATRRTIDKTSMPPDLRMMLFELLDDGLNEGFSLYSYAWLSELMELEIFTSIRDERLNQ